MTSCLGNSGYLFEGKREIFRMMCLSGRVNIAMSLYRKQLLSVSFSFSLTKSSLLSWHPQSPQLSLKSRLLFSCFIVPLNKDVVLAAFGILHYFQCTMGQTFTTKGLRWSGRACVSAADLCFHSFFFLSCLFVCLVLHPTPPEGLDGMGFIFFDSSCELRDVSYRWWKLKQKTTFISMAITYFYQ